jgi:predicted phage-related endonuclease
MTKRKGVLVMSKATVTKTVATPAVVEVTTTVETKANAVYLDKATQIVIEQFIEKRDLITKMEKEKKELEAQIKSYLGEATQGLLADGTLRLEVSHRERRGIDTEALKTAFPEAYEATQTLSKYVVLVAK